MVICSHIHEGGRASDRVGPTFVQNLGRLSEGVAYVLDTENNVSIKPVVDDVF